MTRAILALILLASCTPTSSHGLSQICHWQGNTETEFGHMVCSRVLDCQAYDGKWRCLVVDPKTKEIDNIDVGNRDIGYMNYYISEDGGYRGNSP